MRGRRQRRILLLPAAAALVAMLGATAPEVTATAPSLAGPAGSRQPWVWPVDDGRVAEEYRQPAHRYAEGHRGLDLTSTLGAVVSAPDAGVVAFAGDVAGRPLVTIDHGAGLVSTLEPVAADVSPGERISRGASIGRVAAGGHVAEGALHLGARQDGEYINPLLLLGGIPRAVLLPCC